nr:unnamed protein product [Callosobruchus analis]
MTLKEIDVQDRGHRRALETVSQTIGRTDVPLNDTDIYQVKLNMWGTLVRDYISSQDAYKFVVAPGESKQGLKELVDSMERQTQVYMEKFLQKLEFTEDSIWSIIIA